MQVQAKPSTSQTNAQANIPVSSSMAEAGLGAGKITPPSVLTNTGSIQSSNVSTQAPEISEKAIEEKFDLKPSKKSKMGGSKKQIPTVIGLLILFVALISGVLLFGQGTGVFAPRATPETTPKNIIVSNVTDKTFTVSFFTDESTVGFVKYGLEADSLKQQASDDRDQLSGIVKDYRLHHITVRGLEPGQTYYYVLGTGSSNFDNEGQPYTVATAAKPNQSPISNQTVYGNVFVSDGVPAEGAVVYLSNQEMGTLSSIVKASGSYGISLSNAFNSAKTSYAVLSDETSLDIKVQGVEENLSSSLQTTVALAQPVPDMTLSQSGSSQSMDSLPADLIVADKEELLANLDEMTGDEMIATDEASMSAEESSSSAEEIIDEEASESGEASEEMENTSSGSLGDMIDEEAEELEEGEEPIEATFEEVLDLNEVNENQEATAVVVNTTTPQIKVTLPANTVVRITVHSDTQIDQTMQTDAEGNLILDIASLGENLEPGEHTATYSYIDPNTGEEVTKTYNFTVAGEVQQLAQADTNPTPSIPYGSGNPFVPTQPTASPTASITASPSATASPTPIGTAGAMVATDSGQYNSGSLGTTLALLLAGIFFIATGVWSYMLSSTFEIKRKR